MALIIDGLEIGSVTVDSSGDVTGSGLSKAITDKFVAMPTYGAVLGNLSGSQKQTAVVGLAEMAFAIAEAVVEHLEATTVVEE